MSVAGEPLVRPQTFAFNRTRKLSDDVKIYRLPQSAVGQKSYQVPDGAVPDFSIDVHYKYHTLYVGDGSMERVADKQPKPVIDSTPEGFFSTTSTFVDSESPERRTITMRREKDDALLSKQRTFNDFEGNLYKWKANIKGDLKCTRVADGVIVATFPVHFSETFRTTVGEFTLLKDVPLKTFYLLLSTCMVNYQMERRRRRSRRAGGGGGGGGGGDGG
ncbi:hypothetical protein FRC03_001077 [Tulasnella sp. 419]|nr:hypothetical protein FRC02_003916 [Tulasnella sp. 418]KAG8969732.1 hypothetical protein FRC03_001077 [Tulasnella sp. 419]